MAREDAVGLRAVILLDLRDQFGLDEFEEPVRATAGRKFHFGPVRTPHRGVCRGQVAGAVGVCDRHDDHFRHAPVAREEFDRAGGMAEMRVAVGQIEYGITLPAALVSGRRADQYDPLFAEDLGFDRDAIARRVILTERGDSQREQKQNNCRWRSLFHNSLLRYGTGSGSDLAPRNQPGRYRSLYCTGFLLKRVDRKFRCESLSK